MKMRKLNELKKEELNEIFSINKKLQEIAKEEVERNEMFWVEEKANILRAALKEYCFGFYIYNHFKIIEDYNVIENVILDYVDNFSASERILKMLEDNKNNKKILELLIKEEIIESIKYIENYSDEDYFNVFCENIVNGIENFYINENKELVEMTIHF